MSVGVASLEEFGENLFIILDLELALFYLIFSSLDILLFAGEPSLKRANFLMEHTLGD
jgi:hypothetical protein